MPEGTEEKQRDQASLAPSAGFSGVPEGKVFISYASADKASANSIVGVLERGGISCWIAPRDVTPGVFYADAIVQALNAAQLMVVILSVHSVDSEHVLREVERASSKRRPLVAFRLDATPLPPGFEYFLSASQWLDASPGPMGAALAQLLEAVRRMLSQHSVEPAPVSLATKMPNLWQRLKDNKVAQWTLAYAASAFALLQVVALLVDAFVWPHEVLRIAMIVMLIALPIVPILAWYHGLRAVKRVTGTELVLIGTLLMIGGGLLWQMPRPSARSDSAGKSETIDGKPLGASGEIVAPAHSVAVLPFVDMSEQKDQEYFSDGMSEELIDMLTKIPDLRVPARTSSFYFKGKQEKVADIAKALGVTHVLEGSVRKSGKALRVTAQLIRADTGYHVWSETYDRQIDDIFKVQDEIADAVVKALKLSMLAVQLPQSPTQNAEAHSLLLQGRFFGRRNTKEDRERAIDYYVHALALDPNSAQGWAWLATAYTVQAASGWSERDAGYGLARQAAQHALSIDPNLADAHAALGYVYEAGDWNWSAADKELKRALGLDPENVRVLNMNGHLALNLGQNRTAAAFYRRAVDRDPLSPGAMSGLADALVAAGERNAGERVFRQVASIAPPHTHVFLSLLALDRGDKAAAMSEAQQETAPLFQLVALCAVYSAVGNRTAADKSLAELLEKFPDHPYEIALVYGRRGELDTAFYWLDRALARRDSHLMYIKNEPSLYLTEPLLQRFQNDSRYKSLLRRMNLPP
jgi:TolB-like protein/cytochrome c-type biogenesis protein CcmH/NrfG